MSRPLRWQIVVPRLLLVVVALLGAQYVLGVAARSIVIRSSEAAIRSHVELEHARVSVLDRQVVLSGLCVANPLRPSENLIEADRCQLDIATAPLLHKQAIVESGHVSGLRFATLRDGSAPTGSVTSAATQPVIWFRGDSGTAAREWLAHLAERCQGDIVNQFESVQRTEAFCASWSTQSASIDARAEDLERRAAELQVAIDSAQANPLRNDRFIVDLPQKIADLKKDIADLTADIEKRPDLLETERRAIVAARRRDEELARKQLELKSLEPNAFTAYFLREQATAPLDELVGWLRWMREAVPAGTTTQQSPSRGEDILFAGCRPTPSMLIRALQLEGAACIGGQPVELRGVLTNLSTQPSRHNEPIRLRLLSTGSLPLELQAKIDRTGDTSRDELLVDCQGITLPRAALGRSDQLEMTLGPSSGTLSISIIVDGDKLTGDIQLVQQNVQIKPAVGSNFASVPLASALEETLGRVNSLATHISLSGTLREPTCTLWSNLGPAVAEAMDRALRRVGDQHARLLLVDAGRRVDEQLTAAERQMTEQQTRLASKITGVTARLQNVASGETPRYRLSAEQLGRRLPNNSLFR